MVVITCSQSLARVVDSIGRENKNVGLAMRTTPVKQSKVAAASNHPQVSPRRKCARTPVNIGEENTITVASARAMCWKA